MFGFNVSKDVKSMLHMKRGGNREGSGRFMSNTNCQGIENQCWAKYGGNNIKYNQTLNIPFSVLIFWVQMQHVRVLWTILNLLLEMNTWWDM